MKQLGKPSKYYPNTNLRHYIWILKFKKIKKFLNKNEKLIIKTIKTFKNVSIKSTRLIIKLLYILLNNY